MTDPAPQESKSRKRAERTQKPKRTRTKPEQIIRKGKDGVLWLRLTPALVTGLSRAVDWLATIAVGSDFAETTLIVGIDMDYGGDALLHKVKGRMQRAVAGELTTSPPDRGERGASGAEGG